MMAAPLPFFGCAQADDEREQRAQAQGLAAFRPAGAVARVPG